MPDTDISLRVPVQCIRCGASRTVRLQTVVHGEEIVLEWCCTACSAEWPVKRKDELPKV